MASCVVSTPSRNTCERSSKTNFILPPPNVSTVMRLRIWSILRTVPPTSVTLLFGSGGTSSSGSFSEVVVVVVVVFVGAVVAVLGADEAAPAALPAACSPTAGVVAGVAGAACVAGAGVVGAACGPGAGGATAVCPDPGVPAGEEELWDIITAGSNISMNAG